MCIFLNYRSTLVMQQTALFPLILIIILFRFSVGWGWGHLWLAFKIKFLVNSWKITVTDTYRSMLLSGCWHIIIMSLMIVSMELSSCLLFKMNSDLGLISTRRKAAYILLITAAEIADLYFTTSPLAATGAGQLSRPAIAVAGRSGSLIWAIQPGKRGNDCSFATSTTQID